MLTLLSGVPYWRAHPVIATIDSLAVAFLAALAAMLRMSSSSGKAGWYILVTATMWALSWVSAWNTWLFPIVGEFAIGLFFLFIGIGIIHRSDGGSPGSLAKAWTYFAILVLVVMNAAWWVSVDPWMIGYDGDGIIWPHLVHLSPHGVNALLRLNAWLYIVLASTFLVVLIRERRSRTPGVLGNVFVIGICGVFALTAAFLTFPTMKSGATLEALLESRSYQGLAAMTIPLAFFASAAWVSWQVGTAPARLNRNITVPTPVAVEAGLRSVLRIPTLTLSVWLPSSATFVDAAGHIVSDLPQADDHEIRAIREANGELLGQVTVPKNTAADERIIDAVLAASSSILYSVRLQFEAMERMFEDRSRLLEAERRGRAALARDLHDGVQQDLAAVRIDLHRLSRLPGGESVQPEAQECSRRIQDVIEQVRRITRGIHPPALVERGLAAALEEDVERLKRRAILDITARRFDPLIEVTLYYVLTEAIANADRHARGECITVRVFEQGATVVGEVADDGVGGAQIRLGGGLYNARDRARTLRGSLELRDNHPQGTVVRVTLPESG